MKGTRSVFAERTGERPFPGHRVEPRANWLVTASASKKRRTRLQNAIGGENVTTAVHRPRTLSRECPLQRDFRSDIGALNHVLVSAERERQIPLSELAEICTSSGPAMIRDENGLLTGYVYVGHRGPRPGKLRGRGRALLPTRLATASGLCVLLERPVRGYAAREAPPEVWCCR